MAQVLFQLDETTLVFLPATGTLRGQVCQVTLQYPTQVPDTSVARLAFTRNEAQISVSSCVVVRYSVLKHHKEEIEAILKLDRLNEFPTPSLITAHDYSLLVGA
ncbi:hypothetical protein FRC05_000571 [Tulasnella sp. 425]|nr:hypothetical protein FRC05_000571 [Tulasnella sp. 425]